MAASSLSFRTVKEILPKPQPHWVGDGFHVLPVFDRLAFTSAITPLLMFDFAAPKEFKPSSAKPLGVGQHPHRGFCTVTIAFEGEVEHHDNKGGHGIIRPGDTQWMTAGRGIIHQEYHSKEFTKSGGSFSMAQLWVNLPKQYKMVEPQYQGITNDETPTVPLFSGDNEGNECQDSDSTAIPRARVIAGELLGTKGPAKTYSPVNLWDVSLPTKTDKEPLVIPYPSHHSCIIFVRRGSISIGSNHTIVKEQGVAIMNNDEANHLQLKSLEDHSSVLIMGGEPIEEPIANMGPFVMNTQEELRQAVRDYQEGRF